MLRHHTTGQPPTSTRPAPELCYVARTEIVAVYRQARDRARVMGTLRLRWTQRRISKGDAPGDQRVLARRAALRDELRQRGVVVAVAGRRAS